MTILKLERNGPPSAGLTRMVLKPEDFQSPLPEQYIHLYFEDPEIGLSVGVWTTTEMQEAFGPYPGDEFMLVLDGRVEMVDRAGHATAIETGQSFVLRNGIPISWRQIGSMRKLFLLLHNPKSETPKIDSAQGGVIVLEEEVLAHAFQPEPDSIGGGRQKDSPVFTNDAGTLQVGLWESTAFESDMTPFSVHEFCQLLQGQVTITQQDGTVFEFTAGDVFFVPKGTVCRWTSDGPVRKYYVAVTA
jgi:uncharacterized cupin superfamily protein